MKLEGVRLEEARANVLLCMDAPGEWNILAGEDFGNSKQLCERELDDGHFASVCCAVSMARSIVEVSRTHGCHLYGCLAQRKGP